MLSLISNRGFYAAFRALDLISTSAYYADDTRRDIWNIAVEEHWFPASYSASHTCVTSSVDAHRQCRATKSRDEGRTFVLLTAHNTGRRLCVRDGMGGVGGLGEHSLLEGSW